MDITILNQIAAKLKEHTPDGLLICDASGRVVASTSPDQIGSLNLLAIQCLNHNGPASSLEPGQFSGAAAPLRYQNSRIGALVLPSAASDSLRQAAILSSAVELMYEELLNSRNVQAQTKERDQFLFEWLHMQPPYSEAFQKRGEEFGFQILSPHTMLVFQPQSETFPVLIPMIQNLLDEKDAMVSLSPDTQLILIKEEPGYEKRFHRLLAVLSKFPAAFCKNQKNLSAGCALARECLSLGQLLFPDLGCYDYDYMKTALVLSHADIPGLEHDFSILKEKGSSAQLAETVVSYIQCSGDIQKLSAKLHVHRNSIPYRIRRIKELCGKDLNDAYDLMALYASYIRYICLQEKEQ